MPLDESIKTLLDTEMKAKWILRSLNMPLQKNSVFKRNAECHENKCHVAGHSTALKPSLQSTFNCYFSLRLQQTKNLTCHG